MKWPQIRLYIVIFCTISVLWLNRGHLLSTIYGYPFGISRVDRQGNGIPKINWDWNKYPPDKKKSATQVWINPNRNEPYYAKRILMDKDYVSISFEEDRYKVLDMNDLQLDLVVKWELEDSRLVCKSWIEKVHKIDTNESVYTWFKEGERLLSIGSDDVIDVIGKVNSNTFDYSKVPGLFIKELPHQSSVIVARYEVIDGSIERNLHYCIDEVMGFKEMNQYDCSFSVGEIEYNIREKYVFDNKGETIEYWSYKSEGPIIYGREDLKRDPKFTSYTDFVSSNVRVVDDKYIWFKDSIAVDYVLEEEKLIFMKVKRGGDHPSRRIIYQYE